ncbi:MAG: CopG family ribbon-helix-helix protein [Candidatus Accumulibacter sp.]|nr:CopG family ribbon-helix-helix protein [Accumulibacter sp.]
MHTAILPAQNMTVRLDGELRERLRNLAESRKRTPHWILKEAIQQYVEREEERNALRQAAVESWEEYRATGLHLTHEEADAWLAKLEAGKDAEIPACHP